MKKKVSCGLVLFAGISTQAFAAAGYAYDGLEFILVVAGFLLVLAGFLKGIDYIGKNGKMLMQRIRVFLKKKVSKSPLPRATDTDLLPFSV
jgi:hypothetical protein